MKTTALLILIFTCHMLQAQTFAWVDQIGGTLDDISNTIATDADGNVYTAGRFAGTIDADPGPGVLNLTSAGGSDIFISKVDASGNLIWAKQIGGMLSGDEGSSLAVGASGNVYITGTFNGTVDFDLGAGEFLMTAHPPAYESCSQLSDVFILKLTSEGDFAWARQVGGNGYDRSRAIALSPEEYVVVAGEYSSEGNFPVDLDPTEGTNYVTAVSGAAAFMIKLDPDGAFTWAKQWYSWGVFASGCGFRDALFHPFSLSIDGNGNINCTGDFGSTVDFDPDQGVYSIGTQSNAAFVMKLYSDGGLQWARALNNSGNHAYGKDVIVGPNGNIYSVGAFDGTIDFDPGAAIKNLKAPGGSGPSGIGPSEAYVWVLNASGNYVWAGQLGGSGNDAAYSVDQDASSNIYTTGIFTGTADFDPSGGKKTLKSLGGNDIFVSKLTSSGAYTWAIHLGGTLEERSTGIDVDAGNNIHVTGIFNGTTDFDPAAGTFNLTSFGGQDIFIQKMTQSGGGQVDSPIATRSLSTPEITVYPNPAHEKVRITFVASQTVDFEILLFDFSGKLIQKNSGKASDGENELELYFGNIPPGMYHVMLVLGDRHEMKRVVVQ